MAIHKSALKRARQNEKRNERNRVIRSALRTAIKQFRALIAAQDFEAAEAGLPKLYKTIDKAVTKGIIHRNEGARKKSRLTTALSKVRAA